MPRPRRTIISTDDEMEVMHGTGAAMAHWLAEHASDIAATPSGRVTFNWGHGSMSVEQSTVQREQLTLD